MPSLPPKVSVVVPIYNVEKYLRECLGSVINQTLKEIEIICVDDGSSDSSALILREYAERDSRIKAIYQENLGTSQTRKNGVAATTGQFVMFLDGDDELTPDACEVAFNAISKYKADIVQFGTEIVNVAGVAEERIQMNARMLKPHLGKLENTNLVSACWEKKLFAGNLWNKIFLGDLARKAFAEVQDGLFPRGQDWYAFFIIAYYARSYRGISNALYRYKFGIGVIGGDMLTEKKFGAILAQKRVLDGISYFIKDKPDASEYQSTIQVIRNNFFNQAINAWTDKLSSEIINDCFAKLIDAWGGKDVILALAQKKWANYSAFGKILKISDSDSLKKHLSQKVKTIGFYYRCISNGGAQRVVADLCNLFALEKDEDGNPRFNVVCITDSEYTGSQTEYTLVPSIKRAYVPAFAKSQQADYRKRFEAWHEIISEYKLDVVVSGLWVDPCTFWDALSIKKHPQSPLFITHSHSYNAIPYLWGEESPKRIEALYNVSDGVVSLSECDQYYTEKYNPNVRAIVNPIAFEPSKIQSGAREHNAIIWVGRISPEKRPLDAVKMMAEVVKEVSDAKLYLVGGGNDSLIKEAQTLARKLGVAANIEFTGFTLDVEKYYEKASVFVSTTEYEGFSLTIGESLSHAIPVVCYDMPWLTYIRDGRGITTVERLNPTALSRQVIRLLKNPNEAEIQGKSGREQIVDLKNVNIVSEWRNLFEQIGGKANTRKTYSREDALEFASINKTFIDVFREMRENKKGLSLKKLIPAAISSKKGKTNTGKALEVLSQKAPKKSRDSALKRFLVRVAALFIFSKSKRKAFRVKYMDLNPKDGVDVHALSPEERRLRKQKKRERNPLRRLFNALVPASRSKVAHTEKRIIRHMEWQTQQVLSAVKRSAAESERSREREIRKILDAIKASQAQAERRFDELSRELAELREACNGLEMQMRAHDSALASACSAQNEELSELLKKTNEARNRLFWFTDYRVLGDAFPELYEQLRRRNPYAPAELQENLFHSGMHSRRIESYESWYSNLIRGVFSYMDCAYFESVPPQDRERELKCWFKLRNGYDLDLENPKTFNEKIQWLKLYDATPLKTRLADKYAVREWIREQIGEKYLVPLLGVYDSFDAIDFDKLPDKFVMKTTHGSGFNIVVKDKSELDKAEAKKKTEDWLSRKFEFQGCFEMHYAGIKPRIIIEEFLDIDEDSAYDWQAFCFNGDLKVYRIVVGGAHSENHGTRYFYDANWNKLGMTEFAKSVPAGEISKPDNFDELEACMKKLCKGFLHVRVDFYRLKNGDWKFGEMTFTTASGAMQLYPESADCFLGDMLELPQKEEANRAGSGLNLSEKREPKVIVSLTSYPARIKTVHFAVKSLLSQSLKPDRLVLWLADSQFPTKEAELPDELLNLRKFGLEIRWTEDLRPYKKLVPALREFPEDVIVTADDDVIYAYRWLELLYLGYKDDPKSIPAHRITKIEFDGIERISATAGGFDYYPGASVLNKPTGVGGVLFPPKCFHSDIADKEKFLSFAPTSDDIWFWLMAALSGYFVRAVNGCIPQIDYIPGTQDCGLCKVNDVGGSQSPFQMHLRNVLLAYPQLITLFEKEQSKQDALK